MNVRSRERQISRRQFLTRSTQTAAGIFAAGTLASCNILRPVSMAEPGSKMRFGLVTYLWGQDWDLPTLIRNCETTQVLGVELRTQHAHGVESNLNATERKEVKKRFDDSPVTLLGPGTNFAFHHADSATLQKDIDGAKQYIKLSHDVGGSGVKVKPNALPDGVPVENPAFDVTPSRYVTAIITERGVARAPYPDSLRAIVNSR